MAEGWLPDGADAALDALGSFASWIKLHTAAPGAAGTSNAATETTRQQATWNNTGTDGIIDNSNVINWTNIAGSQDATHFTTWTASTSGSAGASGGITANAYTAGDTYSIAAGALTLSVTLAS